MKLGLLPVFSRQVNKTIPWPVSPCSHCKQLISLSKELCSMKGMVLNYPDFEDTQKPWTTQSLNCLYLWSCAPISSLTLHRAGLDWKRWEKIWNGRNLRWVFPICCRISARGTARQERAANTTWQSSVHAISVLQTWILQVELFQICITKPQGVLFFTMLYLAIFVIIC